MGIAENLKAKRIGFDVPNDLVSREREITKLL